MLIKIKITDAVIKASTGCQSKISSCLIARAVNEIFPNSAVFNGYIYLNFPENLEPGVWEAIEFDSFRTIRLPDKACDLIIKFDNNHTITPTSFEIDVPMEVIEQIGIGQAYKVLSESKTLELVSI